MTILVFPGGLPRALEFVTTHPNAIGASSVKNDPAKIHYSHWLELPYITQPNFSQELKKCINKFSISKIYCPHNLAWGHLKDIVEHIEDVEVLEPSPILVEQKPYKQVLKAVGQLDTPLSEIEMAGILKTSWRIEGEMVDRKIAALSRIFPDLPKGDIIEIGSLYGKSAYVLSCLSRKYSIGNILCIDPWDLLIIDKDKTDVIESTLSQRDLKIIHNGFMMNLSTAENVNFIRGFSQKVAATYKKGTVSTQMGETKYTGKISLLHIDGNHDYEFVTLDYEKWSPKVQPGGWVVFDDYEWSFGDGPKRAGDKFIDRVKPTKAFIDGGAMFVKMPN